MARAFVVALLGAESTGKTTLARDLAAALAGPQLRCTWVSEHLRQWCERTGRTPLRHEQRAIAREQDARIDQAAQAHDLVVADTTGLMVAVYSEYVFGDTSLLTEAAQRHKACDLTLLTALDLPWVADGLQREGPHVQAPVDALLRRELIRHGIDFGVVAGQGDVRLDSAIAAVAAARRPVPVGPQRWHHVCARCGDADCERHAMHDALSSADQPR